MTVPGWPAYLESIAESISRQRLALQSDAPDADVDVDSMPFEPPQHLGPLPRSHAARAQALVRELDHLQSLLVEHRDRTARQLQVQRRLRSSTASTANSAYLDRRD